MINQRYQLLLVSLTYSPQGDGNEFVVLPDGAHALGFTYLFPARGWKRRCSFGKLKWSAAFHLPIPRKGMETQSHTTVPIDGISVSLTYSPQGDGNAAKDVPTPSVVMFHLPIPRKGMETLLRRYRLG